MRTHQSVARRHVNYIVCSHNILIKISNVPHKHRLPCSGHVRLTFSSHVVTRFTVSCQPHRGISKQKCAGHSQNKSSFLHKFPLLVRTVPVLVRCCMKYRTGWERVNELSAGEDFSCHKWRILKTLCGQIHTFLHQMSQNVSLCLSSDLPPPENNFACYFEQTFDFREKKTFPKCFSPPKSFLFHFTFFGISEYFIVKFLALFSDQQNFHSKTVQPSVPDNRFLPAKFEKQQQVIFFWIA